MKIFNLYNNKFVKIKNESTPYSSINGGKEEMFKQLSAKELKEIYAERPWINKNAISNLFLSAFAEAVIPAMDKAMARFYKIIQSTEFIAKIEENIIDESFTRVIEMVKDDLREELVKIFIFDDE